MSRRIIFVGKPPVPKIPDFEVVDIINIEWPTTFEECEVEWRVLERYAQKTNARIVLQSIPGVLAVVLALDAINRYPNWGVLVSGPTARIEWP